MSKNISISGAGLVGSLLACFLAKRGHNVEVFERRPDMRKVEISAGRSINLALSKRGWTALEKVGIADKIREIAIPMKGRQIHNEDGSQAFQPYGQEDQAIYSVSRGDLNMALMDMAEAYENVQIHFNAKCQNVDLDDKTASFEVDGSARKVEADYLFGADGAYSAVRNSLQRSPLFDYSQQYLKHGYKELSFPPSADGGWRVEKNALHIWPRRSFMLIALPNMDGSFTVTLFAPFKGEDSFEEIRSDDDVLAYFAKHFPSAKEHMPDLIKDWHENPTSPLMSVRANPWVKGNVVLIGDAAHAVVPFYGQGMNAGFEDCRILDDLLDEHAEDWESTLLKYNEVRVADGNAIADLAIYNFIEMRDKVADEKFLLRKKIEKHLQREMPELFTPVYSMVTFNNGRYSEALSQLERQNRLFDDILSQDDIAVKWNSEDIVNYAKNWLDQNNVDEASLAALVHTIRSRI